MTTTAPVILDSPRVQDGSSTPRRADIDGLRTLAIALVVVYHVWLGRVSGGVDVFLFISAFFLTASFLRRLERDDPLRLPSFWARRFARLVPAAAVTILATLGFAALAMPVSTWPSTWSQAWASLFYFENWALAWDSVDYYARDGVLPSLFQHFWSLSIQGQIFVLWPLAFAVIALVARRTAWRPRRIAAVVFGGVFAASLVYSIVTTASRQEYAYFDTGARLWEFALGSLLAIVIPLVRVGRVTGALLGIIGVVGLVSCGLVFDVGAGFPGFIALWPTLSAAAVIIAGQAVAWGPVSRMLGSAPMSRVGRIAYSLYLVHWPILIGFLAVTGRDEAGLLGGGAVIAALVAAATLLYLGVERPLRRGATRADVVKLVAAVLVVAVPLVAWQVAERARASSVVKAANPGALVLIPDVEVEIPAAAELEPRGSMLDSEWVWLPEKCSGRSLPAAEAVAASCSQITGADEDAPTVLVWGDSHAEQWMGALIPLAEENGWHMVAVLRGGCTVNPEEVRDDDHECANWQRASADFAEELRADVVVLMGTKAQEEGPGEQVPAGLSATVAGLRAVGSEVVLLRDNPRFGTNVFECVERRGAEDPECTWDRERVLASSNPAQALAGDGVHLVDLTDFLCPDGLCVPVIGNVVVYLDHNHLTWAFARTLAPAMRDALVGVRALGPLAGPAPGGGAAP